MTVEVLFFAGCPGFAELLPRVRELADAAGVELVVRAVETPEAAERERFLGSPSVRVLGRDVDPGATTRTDFGLKCRLYRDGDQQGHAPPDGWLQAALRTPDA